MTTIPNPLEPPPRSTGDAQQDYPLIIDWMYRVYHVVQQSVSFINSQLSQNTVLTELPDPDTATIASAQQTANEAYSLAAAQKSRIDGFIGGEFTISDTDVASSISFDEDQEDVDYRIMIGAKSVSGSPAANSFIVKTKTYTVSGFDVTLYAAPGAGTSVTFEWQLIRN